MRTTYLTDLNIKEKLEEGTLELIDRGGHKHVVKALRVPGYGWIPCARKLLDNYTTKAEHLAIVVNDDEDENPPSTSQIWITRPKVDYFGDWADLDDEVDEPVECYFQKAGSSLKHNFRKEERSGIVNITYFGDDGITNDLFEYWCEPDETLDTDQGLVYSQDGKRLLRSLDKTIDVIKIKEGTEIINDKVFWGVYGPGAGCYHSVSSIYLPNSIKDISEDAFEAIPVKIIVHLPLYKRICRLLPDLVDNIWVIAKLENGEKALVQFP